MKAAIASVTAHLDLIALVLIIGGMIVAHLPLVVLGLGAWLVIVGGVMFFVAILLIIVDSFWPRL